MENHQKLLGSVGKNGNRSASVTCDVLGKIVSMNTDFTELVGLSAEELEYQSIFWFLPKREGQEIRNALKSLVADSSMSRVISMPIGDGIKTKVVNIIPILQDSKIIGYYWLFISEKNKNNLTFKLNCSNRQPVSIGGLLKVGTWSYGFENKEFFASNDTFNIFGRSAVEFDGSPENLMRFIDPKDREGFEQGMINAYKGIPLNLEFNIVTNQGQNKLIHARAEMFFDDKQKPDKMIGIVQDLTAESLMEKDFLDFKKNHEDSTKITEAKEEMEKRFKEFHSTQRLFKMGSWVMDYVTKKLSWSPVTFEIYGISPSEGAPDLKTLISKIIPEDRDKAMFAIEGLPKENPFELEFGILRPNQEVRYLKHLIEVVFDDDNQRVSMRGNVQDVTEQKDLELESTQNLEEMKRLRNKCQLIVENSQDVFEIIDGNGFVQYISPAIENMMGYTSSEIEGHYIWDFVEGEEKDHLKELFKYCLEQPKEILVGKVQANKKSGDLIYLEVSMNNHMNDPEVNGVVLNWKDITVKEKQNNRIYQLANYDELTGLPNRTYFREKVTDQVQNHGDLLEKFALFMIDIEGFKGFNNVLSYEFGDELIKKIGKSIQSIFIDEDIFIARYYGDQFGLIIDKVRDMAECQEIGNRLLELFKKPFIIAQYEMYVSASIGFSVFPEDGTNYEQLLRTASIALRRAKDAGEQGYQAYSPQIDVKTFKEFSLRNDLRKAIDKDELLIYYQPIMHLKSGKILGVEALMRWEHPEWGLVPPDEFIPLAESTGLIIPMGKWLLDQVCQDYLRWSNKGYPEVKIAVNYSGIQFFKVNFVDDILGTIEKYGLNPNFLILEITESVLIEHGKKTEMDLAELKRKGVQIAIDDFGTGYSSLAYLNAINVDILKIDREFLMNVPANENSEKIFRAIINLARDLNIKVVAEGISNWKQLNYLKTFSGTVGQGYIYSKPLPIEAIELKLAVGFIEPEKNYDESRQFNLERRQLFRVDFKNFLEADMTIVEIGGVKAQVGNTKALIKNIGPGGLCFITNVKLPVKKDLILGFVTDLMGKTVKVHGTPVWSEELEQGLHIIGLEFKFDENARMELTRLLNNVQIRVKKDYGFNDGSFVTDSINRYFTSIANRI